MRSLQEALDHDRMIQAIGLDLPLTASWEQIAAARDMRLWRSRAIDLGLPETASRGEIEARWYEQLRRDFPVQVCFQGDGDISKVEYFLGCGLPGKAAFSRMPDSVGLYRIFLISTTNVPMAEFAVRKGGFQLVKNSSD